jgi:hypothetical protein
MAASLRSTGDPILSGPAITEIHYPPSMAPEVLVRVDAHRHDAGTGVPPAALDA